MEYAGIVLLLLIVVPIAFLYLAPVTATRIVLSTGNKVLGLAQRQIRVPDGLRYVYLEGGRGEPLMLLHGFGGDKSNFMLIARYLTTRFRIIIPDHIGFGESDHPANADYTSSAQARRLKALAAALGIDRLHLGGNSMGGHIAMAYASHFPEEVKSLWLLDPGGVWSAPESEVRRTLTETGKNPLLADSEDAFARLFAYVMQKPPLIPRPLLNVMAQARIENLSLEEGIFEQLNEDGVEKLITGSRVPTLIVWGMEDRVFNHATADILHRLMPNSRVIKMQGVGHLPMLENPKATAKDYLRFRASL
jgi:pimeloyl-ACP methyl ester carboxylesterase